MLYILFVPKCLQQCSNAEKSTSLLSFSSFRIGKSANKTKVNMNKTLLSSLLFSSQMSYSLTRFAIYETVRDMMGSTGQGPMPFYQKVLLGAFGGGNTHTNTHARTRVVFTPPPPITCKHAVSQPGICSQQQFSANRFHWWVCRHASRHGECQVTPHENVQILINIFRV